VLAQIMSGFCALPLIGLYFSLQRWNFFAAWLAACLLGLLPAALGRIMGVAELPLFVLQLGTALGAVLLLQVRLRRRSFLLARGKPDPGG
jgi:hypothetical protein